MLVRLDHVARFIVNDSASIFARADFVSVDEMRSDSPIKSLRYRQAISRSTDKTEHYPGRYGMDYRQVFQLTIFRAAAGSGHRQLNLA